MTSTLTRLFNLAKAVGAEAKENYTTEALAAAIREDPTPLLDALRNRDIVDAKEAEKVESQVYIEGTGKIDLIVQLRGTQAKAIWFEVKVDAGESGDQIQRYLGRIASDLEHKRPTLVVLSPKKLTERPDVRWLPWQTLYESIPRDGTAHAYWRDFREYLKDIHMADDSNEPTTPEERRALGPAHRLLLKMAKVLTPAGARANELWPGSSWPADDGATRKQLAARFGRGEGFTIEHKTSYWPCGVSMGAHHDDETGEGWLGIWVWCEPRRVVERDRIWAAANELKGAWDRDTAGWEVIGIHRRLSDFKEHADATAWLREQLDDLSQAGLFKLLPGLRSGKDESEEDDEEQE